MLNPNEKTVHPEIAARAKQILEEQVNFRDVKQAGPAATAFYVWVGNNIHVRFQLFTPKYPTLILNKKW